MTRMAKNYLAMQMHGLLTKAAVYETMAICCNWKQPERHLILYLNTCFQCHLILNWLERHPSKAKIKETGTILKLPSNKEKILSLNEIRETIKQTKPEYARRIQ